MIRLNINRTMTMKYFNLGGSDNEPLYSSSEKEILCSKIASLQHNIVDELRNTNIDTDYIDECINIIKKAISEIIKLK